MRYLEPRWRGLLAVAILLVACAGRRAGATEILYEKHGIVLAKIIKTEARP